MISLPGQFDSQREHILFVFRDADVSIDTPRVPPASLRYVKLVRPKGPSLDDDAIEAWIDEESTRLWMARYGELPSRDALYDIWADVLAAESIPYDGPTCLTPSEQEIIYSGGFGDLTIALLYVMIEGLGWRPGAWCTNGGIWPEPAAMMEFYRHWQENDDPEGALLIALTLYAAKKGGECAVGWQEIAAIAAGIDQQAMACRWIVS